MPDQDPAPPPRPSSGGHPLARVLGPVVAAAFILTPPALSVLLGSGCISRDWGCARKPDPPESEADRKLYLARNGVDTRAAFAIHHVGADGWYDRAAVLEDRACKRYAVDPWGRPYHDEFTREGELEHYVVWSDGPDGLPNTADDIGSNRYTLDRTLTLNRIAERREAIRKQLTSNAWGDSAVIRYEQYRPVKAGGRRPAPAPEKKP